MLPLHGFRTSPGYAEVAPALLLASSASPLACMSAHASWVAPFRLRDSEIENIQTGIRTSLHAERSYIQNMSMLCHLHLANLGPWTRTLLPVLTCQCGGERGKRNGRAPARAAKPRIQDEHRAKQGQVRLVEELTHNRSAAVD